LTAQIKFDKKKFSPGTESKSSKGNPVRNGNGPAAVIGDETGKEPLFGINRMGRDRE